MLEESWRKGDSAAVIKEMGTWYLGARRIVLAVAFAAVSISLRIPTCWSVPINLANNNSTVAIDPSSQLGMYSWLIDGVDQMGVIPSNKPTGQWWWIGVGNGPQVPLNTQNYTGGFGGGPFALMTYSGVTDLAGLGFTFTCSLLGGSLGSQTSSLTEAFSVSNTTGVPIQVRIYQYTDLDLNGTLSGQVANFPYADVVNQQVGLIIENQTTVSPSSAHHQADIDGSLLVGLNGAVAYTLNDTPAFGGGSVTGDAEWGFEWNVQLAPVGQIGSDFSILVTKRTFIPEAPPPQSVPEPSTVALLGLGLGALLVNSSRRFGFLKAIVSKFQKS